MKSIVLTTVYFGEFPYYFSLFKESANFNKDIKFIIFSDIEEEMEEGNVKVIRLTQQKFKELASEKLGFPINTPTAYKLCDFKPVLGKIFEDYFKDYDFWGHIDLDIIWGDINKFIPNEILENYDLISGSTEKICGPFTIYKNNGEYNDLQIKVFGEEGYKNLINSPEFEYIDEIWNDKLIKALPNLKIFNSHKCGSGAIDLVRYGKNRTPAYWSEGKMIVESYQKDYPGQKVFCGFGAETMLFHVREKVMWHEVDLKEKRVTSPKTSDSLFFRIKSCENFRIERESFNAPYKKIDKVLFIHACIGAINVKNYYHWITECVPHILNAVKEVGDEDYKIILYSYEPLGDKVHYHDLRQTEFVNYYLKLIGIKDRVITVDVNKKYEIQSAIFYENFQMHRGVRRMPDKNIKNIRNFAFSYFKMEEVQDIYSQRKLPKKIYLSRGRTRVMGDDAEKMILSKGFLKINMEDYDVIHQAAIINYADVIISTHGAQLGNLIFCKNGAKIIEISNGFNYACFADLLLKTMEADSSLNFEHDFVFEKHIYEKLKEYKKSHTLVHEKYLIKDPLNEGKVFIPFSEKIKLEMSKSCLLASNASKHHHKINPCMERLEKLLNNFNIL